jgi:lipoprotein-anchoring transpeptidase ErfK/SrfK
VRAHVSRVGGTWRAALAVAAFAVLLVAPAARSDTAAVIWSSPTPVDKAQFTVKAGKEVKFGLTASSEEPGGIVHISPVGRLPVGVRFTTSDGVAAHGAFEWAPDTAGTYTVKFTATLVGTTTVAPTVSYVVHVKSAIAYPYKYTLTSDTSAHWAPVIHKAKVYSKPGGGRVVTTLGTKTTDSETQNLVLILNGEDLSAGKTWYRARLPILPNNSTGWIKASDLGELYPVSTHLYVDRAHFRATLKKNGKVIFTTRVGVGRSIWPTPRGEFYIRSKLTNFNDPFYGPIAFGTSARSETLTDWPGGGYVGVHGTNQPEILPGRVSHGCIRLKNAAIVQLARLMPVGTPLTIK